jgi:hypothetical protein
MESTRGQRWLLDGVAESRWSRKEGAAGGSSRVQPRPEGPNLTNSGASWNGPDSLDIALHNVHSALN